MYPYLVQIQNYQIPKDIAYLMIMYEMVCLTVVGYQYRYHVNSYSPLYRKRFLLHTFCQAVEQLLFTKCLLTTL